MNQVPETKDGQEDELVSLSVRITRATYDQFKAIADREFRPVAAEMRRLIQERIDSEPQDLGHESRQAAA